MVLYDDATISVFRARGAFVNVFHGLYVFFAGRVLRVDTMHLPSLSVFRGEAMPLPAQPVGYAALILHYEPEVPTPYELCAVTRSHHPPQPTAPGSLLATRWRLFSPRYLPDPRPGAHLQFALKHEGIRLDVLARIFQKIDAEEIAGMVRHRPSGIYSRRLWFLYEWLTKRQLALPDLARGNYAPVVDAKMQYSVAGERSKRHRVLNNLPGSAEFCPMVFRSESLRAFDSRLILEEARKVMEAYSSDIARRSSDALLLKDSRSNYAIEGEAPPASRLERWGRIVRHAGTTPLSREELESLQAEAIGKSRFIRLGLRSEGGFVGQHERETGMPVPEHISARPDDLPQLVEQLTEYAEGATRELSPVVAAACVAFAFVYIHPFSDGNGRIHRYLIHHVLSRNGFHAQGLVFPISAVMLDRIEQYREVLQCYSQRLLPHIRWEETRDHNVTVLNDTADLYRYIDLTPHAEFLASAIVRTVEHDLPNETEQLKAYDEFKRAVQEFTSMSDKLVNTMYRILAQNGGKLPQRRRSGALGVLTDHEVARIEMTYERSFGGD